MKAQMGGSLLILTFLLTAPSWTLSTPYKLPYILDSYANFVIDDDAACDSNQPLVVNDITRKMGNIVAPGQSSLVKTTSNDSHCSWVIVAPKGFQVFVELKSHNFNNVSSLRFYDGSIDGQLLEEATFKYRPLPFVSSSNIMYISYHGLKSKKLRFSFWYTFVRKPEVCPEGTFCCRHNDRLPYEAPDLPKKCFTKSQKCDGHDDCGDGTDEENCLNLVRPKFDVCGKSIIPPLRKLFQPKIKGGQKSKPGSWPWMVSISHDKVGPLDTHVCGGVLIDAEWVMTAGHCIQSEPSFYSLHFGKFNMLLRDDLVEHIRYIKQVIPHPDFDYELLEESNFGNDIALVRLNAPLPTNNMYIRPICLPPPDFTFSDGESGMVTGWGKDEGTAFDLVLKQARLPVISGDECREMLKEAEGPVIDDSILCAGFKSGGDDTCPGDSGGPFMLQNSTTKNWMVTGIISAGGEVCGSPKQPGLYTFVPSFVKWIDQVMRSS